MVIFICLILAFLLVVLRGNVFLPKNESGLSKDSVALIHQIVVVDKIRLEERISKLPKKLLSKIEDEIDYVTKE